MGGDMREIVDAEQIGRVFAVLAAALPPLCMLAGWWYGGRARNRRLGAILGLLIGLLGPLNWVLWQAYNRITDRLGLDTVLNLAVNVIVFLGVGALIGVGVGLCMRHIGRASDGTEPTDEVG